MSDEDQRHNCGMRPFSVSTVFYLFLCLSQFVFFHPFLHLPSSLSSPLVDHLLVPHDSALPPPASLILSLF